MSSTSKSLLLVTGLSGAGKSTALSILEDFGFYCIDNLPFFLFDSYIQKEIFEGSKTGFAVGMDIRTPQFFKRIEKGFPRFRKKIPHLKILFLTASEAILIRRFSETRRRHPLTNKGKLLSAIRKERKIAKKIEKIADYIVDTTYLNQNGLRAVLYNLLGKKSQPSKLPLSFISFGYRYGIPPQCDLVFDVRFLPNPYFNSALKLLDGTHKKVQNFVLKRKETILFIRYLTDFLNFLIPQYAKEGKSYLTIAFGCTGGKHRSVSLAHYFSHYFEKKGFWVDLDHRDVHRI